MAIVEDEVRNDSEEENEIEVVVEEDDGDQDSDDSDDEDEDDEALEQKVSDLQRRINEDPYNYDEHIELIQALWGLSDLDRWRVAFDQLQQLFILKPEHWLLRLQTEVTISHSEQSRDHIGKLFQDAALDCYSIPIFSEWCSWALSGSPAEARAQLDEILSRAGADPFSGKLFWDAKFELEKAQLDAMSETDAEYKGQQESVLWSLEEAASRPLLRAEQAWPLLHDLAATAKDQHYLDKVEKQHNIALEYLQKISPYEDKLLTMENAEEKCNVYQEYIETVKQLSQDDKYAECDSKGILKVLYDRATTECPSTPASLGLLVSFARHAEVSSSRATYARVLDACARRCPRRHSFWSLKMQLAEKEAHEFEQVKSIFETALSKDMESYKEAESLWMSYLEYTRRQTDFASESDVERLRGSFRLAWDSLAEVWGEQANDCEVPLFWARLEYRRLGNPKQGKEIFEEIFSESTHHTTLHGATYYTNTRPNDCEVPLFWARLEYRRLGNPKQGKEIFEEIFSESTHHTTLHGATYYTNTRPNDCEVPLFWARLEYRRLGNPKQGKEIFEEIFSESTHHTTLHGATYYTNTRPNDCEVPLFWARLEYRRLGNPKQGKEIFEEIFSESTHHTTLHGATYYTNTRPNDCEVPLFWARLEYRRLGKPKQGKEIFEEIFSESTHHTTLHGATYYTNTRPKDCEVPLFWARLEYRRLGNPKQGKEIFEEIFSESTHHTTLHGASYYTNTRPNDCEVPLFWARLEYRRLGKPKQGKEIFEEIFSESTHHTTLHGATYYTNTRPNDCEVPLFWARLEYRRLGNPKQGKEIFEEIFSESTHHTTLHGATYYTNTRPNDCEVPLFWARLEYRRFGKPKQGKEIFEEIFSESTHHTTLHGATYYTNTRPNDCEEPLFWARLEYRRLGNPKQGKEIFEEIFSESTHHTTLHGATYYTNTRPNDCEVPLFWARLEYRRLGNPKQGKEIFEEIFKYGDNKTLAKYWEALIHLESSRDPPISENKLRELFKRALKFVSDYPVGVARLWTDYERDFAPLHTMRECALACEAKIKEWRENYQAMKEKMTGQKQKGKQQHKQQNKKTNKLDNKKKNKKDEAPRKGKRKSDDSEGGSEVKRKKEGDMEVEEHEKKDSGGTKRSHDGDGDESREGEGESKRARRDDSAGSEPRCAAREACTLFVSNLEFKVDEQKVRDALSKYGEIVSLRVKAGVKAFGGSICYCQYKTPECVDEAIKHDRTPLDGRPMFFSRYSAKKSKATFKYSTTAEKNKLFVKNLPYSHCTKEKLNELFQEHGKLKDVRAVTHKDGKPKGLAYIEYEDDESAAKALEKTNGLLVDERKIEVLFSAPPPRKEGATSLGQPKREATGGMRRTQLSSLIPSSVLKASTSKAPANGATAATQPHANGEKRPLSNADFRSLLLK